VVEVHRDWAPSGADRFYNLVKNGFYDNTRFFRVLEGFMAQFGVNGDPKVSAVWRESRIKDDPVKVSNKRTFVTFATAGPNTRTTQVFISYGDNSNLDSQGFAPFGQVVSGMKVVDSLYNATAPHGGAGPIKPASSRKETLILEAHFPIWTTSKRRPSCRSERRLSMIRKSGSRFSEKIMLKQCAREE
jgi:peptidyl-prolyl cis-trans isomerase A (cyclophilin A)